MYGSHLNKVLNHLNVLYWCNCCDLYNVSFSPCINPSVCDWLLMHFSYIDRFSLQYSILTRRTSWYLISVIMPSPMTSGLPSGWKIISTNGNQCVIWVFSCCWLSIVFHACCVCSRETFIGNFTIFNLTGNIVTIYNILQCCYQEWKLSYFYFQEFFCFLVH